jgi:hypothetical protein
MASTGKEGCRGCWVLHSRRLLSIGQSPHAVPSVDWVHSAPVSLEWCQHQICSVVVCCWPYLSCYVAASCTKPHCLAHPPLPCPPPHPRPLLTPHSPRTRMALRSWPLRSCACTTTRTLASSAASPASTTSTAHTAHGRVDVRRPQQHSAERWVPTEPGVCLVSYKQGRQELPRS